MDAVILVVVIISFLYAGIALIKKYVDSPKWHGGFPYSRNRRSYKRNQI